MPTQAELQAMLEELLQRFASEGEAPTAEEIEEVLGDDVLADVGRDQYVPALEGAMEAVGVPEDAYASVHEQLDGEGNYDPAGLRDNIQFLFESEEITNSIDNSIEVEGGAGGGYDDHGAGTHVDDITQHNTDNQANASGDGAIAGRDQWGQFQTGEGAQTGDYNSGVVNQGDNSGQQAGGTATGGDFTTGDGNFDNEGHIGNSAIAFGGGDATNATDQSYDGSVNDSYNDDNVGNVNDSYNQDNVGNTEYTTETTYEENLNADLHVDDSFKVEVEDGYEDDHHYDEADLHD